MACGRAVGHSSKGNTPGVSRRLFLACQGSELDVILLDVLAPLQFCKEARAVRHSEQAPTGRQGRQAGGLSGVDRVERECFLLRLSLSALCMRCAVTSVLFATPGVLPPASRATTCFASLHGRINRANGRSRCLALMFVTLVTRRSTLFFPSLLCLLRLLATLIMSTVQSIGDVLDLKVLSLDFDRDTLCIA